MGTMAKGLGSARTGSVLNSGEAVMAFAAHLAAAIKDQVAREDLYCLAVAHIRRNRLEMPRKGWQQRVKLPSRSRS